ncbi:MAG: cation diffusion facilitator family transporter [Chloroflexota bacterium]
MSTNHTHPHFSDLTNQTTQRLALSLLLTLIFVIVEAVAGTIANSLALLTDAAHNFTDVIALGLSWYALRIATQPAHAGKTFGYHRVGILVALVNSTTLILIAFGIFYEAWRRFISPPVIDAPILIGVGALAFVVNIVTAWLVHKGSDHDLNLRSTFIHLMGDVLSTIGAVIAGIVIFFTQWNWLDPLVSVLIGALILWNAWGILRQTIHILLESTPENIDMQSMLDDLLTVKGVRGVHDLHVWSINENLRAFSAHVMTEDISISAGADIQRGVNEILFQKYNIQHMTLQLECEGCDPSLLYCDISEINHIHEHAQN